MSTRKLLLADDSVTIQKVVNLTFADEGIEVIAVGNGDSAMEKMAEISPDLVMADINMPGLTGYQVCERIKQDENYKGIPVILLVGSFEPFDETEARRVGADDFLTKPFQSIRQLVSKVTVLLDASDRNHANLYDQTANNSFADTLYMNVSEITDSDQASDLGDAGMDDEMIQTNSVSSFALDESAKFETKDFETYEASDDDKKTQPLSVYDLKEFSFVADSSEKESEISESIAANESEAQNYTENADANDSEPTDSVENKSGEPELQSQDSAQYPAGESQPDARDFYESVLEESDADNEKKANFSSFLDSSDDDLLEIPFDEDDEWETEEAAEEPANVSAESTEPAPIAEEDEQNPSVESVENEEKADGQFEEQNQITEEIDQNQPVEDKEKTEESSEEQFQEENQSLIEELPQPESFEENQAQEFVESEKSASPETGEIAQTEDSDEEISSNEYGGNFQTQEFSEENILPENVGEIRSPEAAEEVSQSEDSQSEFTAPEENYHGENEIVVGSLVEPENGETESAGEEERSANRLENQSAAESAAQFSPEVIDAIARRVVEMMSEKVVREIAWEVVPQHADLVIKKAVEEKLAEETLKE